MGESQLTVLKLHNLSNYAKTFFFLKKIVARCCSGLAADLRHWKVVISRVSSSHVMINLSLDV